MKQCYRMPESTGKIEGRQSVDKEQGLVWRLLQGWASGGF